MRSPVVYLISAGPGDPGLIAVKGVECIAKADTVFYGGLANPRFLAAARPDAELVFVGEEGLSAFVSPEEIRRAVVDKAREGEGRTVAWVKAGDAFLDPDGAADALALAASGVPFEIVPGCGPSASAAYAGIPLVTAAGASVAFVSEASDRLPKADTVCLIGASDVAGLAARLIEQGRPPETPVAVVADGTTPRQRVVTGTLADIGRLASEEGVASPVLVVVGDAVGMRERLRWFENGPLFGRSVVVTRSRSQAGELADLLAALGAEVLEFPTISTVDPESFEPLDEAILNLDVYHWVVLTSVNAADRFFARLRASGHDARALAHVKVAAVGPATAARTEEHGILPDFVPAEHRAEGILEGFCERGLGEGVRVLFPRALEAREVLPDTLRERGAIVDVVPVYRTVTGPGESGVLRRLVEGSVDVVTFTSGSTVRNFLELTDSAGGASLLDRVLVASIGPVTSKVAEKLGVRVDIEPREYTIPALVDAIKDRYNAG